MQPRASLCRWTAQTLQAGGRAGTRRPLLPGCVQATASPSWPCPHLSRAIRATPVGGHDYVQSAQGLEESRMLVLRLYKKILRSVPVLMRQFEVEGEGWLDLARANIRQFFAQHADVVDVPVIDLLRHKGEIEWEESILMHKTKSHFHDKLFGDIESSAHLRVAHGLSREKAKSNSKYLNEFYQGVV